MPGSWTRGSELAAADIACLEAVHDCRLVRARATRVVGHDHYAEVVLEDGRTFSADAVVVATGVVALTADDVDWIRAPGLRLPPLWRTAADEVAAARHAVVLGGDRPLGTWLRTHPDAAVQVEVLFPASDAYKTAEIQGDPRVRLSEVDHVTVTALPDRIRFAVQRVGGGLHTFTADVVLGNLGSEPAVPAGDLQAGPDGYCPPVLQHPRIFTAGELRSARFQRIATAQGAGAAAELQHYYHRQNVDLAPPAVDMVD